MLRSLCDGLRDDPKKGVSGLCCRELGFCAMYCYRYELCRARRIKGKYEGKNVEIVYFGITLELQMPQTLN